MIRSITQRIGLPPGSGVLFSTETRVRMVAAVAGMLMLTLLEVLAVAATLPLIQALNGSEPSLGPLEAMLPTASTLPQRAAQLGALVFVAFLVKGLVSIAVRWWTIGFIARQQVGTGEKLMRYYLTAPYSLALTRGVAVMLRTLNDAITTSYGRVVQGALGIVAESATILALMGVLAWVAPLPTLGVGAYFLLAGFVLDRSIRRPALTAGERQLETSLEIYRNAVTPLYAIKEVKLRGSADWFARSFAEARMRNAEAARVGNFLAELPKYVLEIVFIVGIALMAVIAYATSDPADALSLLGVFAIGGFRILPSVNRLLANLSAIRVGRKSIDLLLPDLIEASNLARMTDGPATERMPMRTGLEFKAVRFAYSEGAEDVLQGIDLKIPLGASVAVVGPSGAGKSTLVDLLLGLHEPTAGAILCDGVDISSNLGGWQSNLAVVPQEVYLIDGSIQDNIVFGEDAVDLERLSAAVVGAQLTQVVDSSPEGLSRDVGEGGSHLSGGQRQRIGIARALYRNPRLLVLDEATSALDNETEHRITDTIRQLHGTVTTVVIAHRLSTLRHCDFIVYLAEGSVTTAASFAELADINPDFARLLELASLHGQAEPNRA